VDIDLYSPHAVAVFTLAFVLLAFEAGRLLGRLKGGGDKEHEAQTSSIVGSMLGLIAFLLAFTFAFAADRYDDRKSLVREEANAIGTAFLRSAFLPEAGQAEASGLLRRYVDLTLEATRARDPDRIRQLVEESVPIQEGLWRMAVVEARRDLNSDVAALYIEALNEMFDIRSTRIAVALEAPMPVGVWLVLYAVILLGSMGVGYHGALVRSSRSWTLPLLAVSFALVVGLISALDRLGSSLVPVPQGPLLSLKASIEAPAAGRRE
jgi:hypothetical protein